MCICECISQIDTQSVPRKDIRLFAKLPGLATLDIVQGDLLVINTSFQFVASRVYLHKFSYARATKKPLDLVVLVARVVVVAKRLPAIG